MKADSVLDKFVGKYYPETLLRIQELMASNALLEKLLKQVYSKLNTTVQKYADHFERIKVVLRMVEAWRTKAYSTISKSSIAISILVLLYIVSPIDIFPDFIPIIGGLDDVLLIGFLLKIIDKEIEKFVEWEKGQ